MRGGDIDIAIHKKTSKCSNFYLNHLMKIIFNTFKLTKKYGKQHKFILLRRSTLLNLLLKLKTTGMLD